MIDLPIDLLITNKNKDKTVDLILSFLSKENYPAIQKITDSLMYEASGRAFIKIQTGCNKFCSYCLIPYLRGRSQSVPVSQVVRQIKTAQKQSVKEVVLTGIDISQYQDGKAILTDLLKQVLTETSVERIRLGSVYPEVFTKDFLDLYSQNVVSNVKNGRLCRHFHISLQSACDQTLKRMNRHYTIKQFKKTVAQVKKAIPGVSITTDVIVGFPGETDQDFMESLQNIQEIGFSKIHVFPYSNRPGTLAGQKEKKWGEVFKKTKLARAKKLRDLSKQLEENFRKQFINQTLGVLIEAKNKQGEWVGWSDNYIKFQISNPNLKRNQIFKICLS
ncbi:MiaB/RimO family radical SAM methylthiotransferase [Candidatus Beckwithbacteria bacterium]|nr:MiaB/RimO family radical SAM methylthiotransferase [Candidatus Beckwithbacteria bacterium]